MGRWCRGGAIGLLALSGCFGGGSAGPTGALDGSFVEGGSAEGDGEDPRTGADAGNVAAPRPDAGRVASDGSAADPDAAACAPQQVFACACDGGQVGTQTCQGDGTPGPCDCAGEPGECTAGARSAPGAADDPCAQQSAACAAGAPSGVAIATCGADGRWGACACEAAGEPCPLPIQTESCDCGSGPGTRRCGGDLIWGPCTCTAPADAGAADAGAADGGSSLVACTSSSQCTDGVCCDQFMSGGTLCLTLPTFCYCVPPDDICLSVLP